jgi:hypothetical protein
MDGRLYFTCLVWAIADTWHELVPGGVWGLSMSNDINQIVPSPDLMSLGAHSSFISFSNHHVKHRHRVFVHKQWSWWWVTLSYIYIIIDALLPELFEEVTSGSVASSVRSEDEFTSDGVSLPFNITKLFKWHSRYAWLDCCDWLWSFWFWVSPAVPCWMQGQHQVLHRALTDYIQHQQNGHNIFLQIKLTHLLVGGQGPWVLQGGMM